MVPTLWWKPSGFSGTLEIQHDFSKSWRFIIPGQELVIYFHGSVLLYFSTSWPWWFSFNGWATNYPVDYGVPHKLHQAGFSCLSRVDMLMHPTKNAAAVKADLVAGVNLFERYVCILLYLWYHVCIDISPVCFGRWKQKEELNKPMMDRDQNLTWNS